ncbi:cytochrome P450 monooxygenase CYP63 [Suillus lakei]|nr:cytochrome P450 monooxygenase CYP63 [Suillus lakei]
MVLADHAKYYRFRILKDIFQGLVAPPVLVSLCCRTLNLRFGWWSIPAYLLAIPLAAFSEPIPRVVGKWPGNIDVMLKLKKGLASQYIYEPFLELFEEYQCTTLNTRFLWVDNIITMDQEHSKCVLATGFSQFWRGTAQRERLENFLGNGIFNRDDEHRSLARPFFTRNRISDFELFEKYAGRTITVLSNLASRNQPCNVQDLFARFTIDAASDFLFGQNLDTLSKKLPLSSSGPQSDRGSTTDDSWGTFAQAFEAVQRIITMRGRTGFIWPVFELFDDKTAPHVEIIKRWLDPLVKQTLDQKTFLEHLADSTEGLCFFSFLARIQRLIRQQCIDAGMIRDQLLNVLLASRDTTACLLTYVTYFMALYPNIAAKMRREVLDVCGNNVPTHEDIRKLKYIKAVLDETLRLYPPVPLNSRQTRPQPCTLPLPDRTYPTESRQPLYLPKSTTIWYSSLLTQRNKELWGPDADDFDPERWIDPQRVARFTSNPMMFTPFSAGPRIASFFLVRLLQQFDTFTLATDAQPPSSLPPAEWKLGRGRQRVETDLPRSYNDAFHQGAMKNAHSH